jgi:DnaK suppressor protein
VRNDLDLAYFRKCLEDRLAAITAGEDDRKKETAPVELDQGRVGRLSRMDAMQRQEMSRASARRIEIERQRILSALDRMDDQEYGYCIVCGDDIPDGRLRFDPSVPTCIACAREAEDQ